MFELSWVADSMDFIAWCYSYFYEVQDGKDSSNVNTFIITPGKNMFFRVIGIFSVWPFSSRGFVNPLALVDFVGRKLDRVMHILKSFFVSCIGKHFLYASFLD